MAVSVLSTYGQQLALKLALNILGSPPTIAVRLFTDTLTVLPSTTLGTFTAPTFTPYGDITLVSWPAPTDDGFHATATHDPVYWSFDSGSSPSSKGYILVDTDNTQWVAGGRFDINVLASAGTFYLFRPRFQWRSNWRTSGDNGGLGVRLCEAGRLRFTRAMVGLSGVSGFRLRLFKNNASISEDTVIGDLTECDYPGYAYQLGNTWTTPALVSGEYESNCGNKFFIRGAGASSAQTAYGYYCTDSADDALLWCDKFSSTFDMSDDGDVAGILPKMRCLTENASSP